MALTYRYKAVQRPQGTIKSPIIPITLRGSGESIDFTALIDSGADVSAISQEVGELLGLDLSGPQEPTKGIVGEVPSVETKVWLTIGKDREKYPFFIPVKVLLGKVNIGILLGRKGFFDKFSITFEEINEKVVLKRILKR